MWFHRREVREVRLVRDPDKRCRLRVLAESRLWLLVCCLMFATTGLISPARGDDQVAAVPQDALVEQLRPLLEIIRGERQQFAITIDVQLPIGGETQQIGLTLNRYGDDSYDFSATHPDYAIEIRRREQLTAMFLPRHQRVYYGRGTLATEDHLAATGLLRRVISSGCELGKFLPLLEADDPQAALGLAMRYAPIQRDEKTDSWLIDSKVSLRTKSPSQLPAGEQAEFIVSGEDFSVLIRLTGAAEIGPEVTWGEQQASELTREELERQLCRGMRRAGEVLLPSASLGSPIQLERQVAGGKLQYVEGQRLVTLTGTPEEIGRAHGQLLRRESQRCIDSVLYAFGTVQTVVSGDWFRHTLDNAYARLKPHIPADHIAETRALAVALQQPPELLETLNVFPELFHCSGFAVFDSATVDGTLYHGRVLDYMTTIGLQDCATTFIVAVDDKIPFLNVGYAGFTGSVSGMNAKAISLGEMGGRGEGQWDGVPMATLMRRAMEECSSLDEVIRLWAGNPRTCEYYYVFADGKTNAAVGVAATPETIEFVYPGDSHPLLGTGIRDAVVLSAGSRLETLRARVTENHGSIDANKAMWLMSRPVAMESNLHNVLFVPAEGVAYVANASHKQPAAERPYVRFAINDYLPGNPQIAAKRVNTQP